MQGIRCLVVWALALGIPAAAARNNKKHSNQKTQERKTADAVDGRPDDDIVLADVLASKLPLVTKLLL